MTNQTANGFSAKIRDRTVRMVLDHKREHASRWATVVSISSGFGWIGQTLHELVKKAERDGGGVGMEMAARLRALERESRELRQAKEILRKASAYSAQAELDCQCQP